MMLAKVVSEDQPRAGIVGAHALRLSSPFSLFDVPRGGLIPSDEDRVLKWCSTPVWACVPWPGFAAVPRLG